MIPMIRGSCYLPKDYSIETKEEKYLNSLTAATLYNMKSGVVIEEIV